jgi:hypothetical protein
MKCVVILVAVFSFSFYGCLSVDTSGVSGTGVPGTVSSGTASSGTSTPITPSAAGVSLPPGSVIFDWNSNGGLFKGGTFSANSVKQIPGSDIYFGARTNIPISNGGFRLGAESGGAGPRLIIGNGPKNGSGTPVLTSTTGVSGDPPNLHVPGQLDLSEGTFRLTVDYTDIVGDRTGDNVLFRVYCNNNTAGLSNSVFGSGSMIRIYQNPGELRDGFPAGTGRDEDIVEPGRIIITFTPSVMYANRDDAAKSSLKNAFLALYTHRSSHSQQFMTITGIKLERLD